MKKIDIIKFINRFKLPYIISVKFVSSIVLEDLFAAQVYISDDLATIELNKKIFMYSKDTTYLKALILHELGHIYVSEFKIKNPHIEEYSAHNFALKTALSHRLIKVHKELLLMLEEWEEYKWNECRGQLRPYIKAVSIMK